MNLSLVEASQSGFTIVCSEGAGLEFAADELARYLAIVTGASLPIAAQAEGQTLELRIEAADQEQYGWRISQDTVVFHGDEPLTVLFAVYHFLETHCGCRWLSEFEGGEIVPRLETLAVSHGEAAFRPAMTHRAFTNFPAIDRLTVSMVDWMAKNRFNRFMIFANMAGSFEAYEKLLRPELVARGMKIEMGHHSFRYFLPPRDFFQAHPEWYSLLKGERRTDGQLCTANPQVAEALAERVCGFFDQHPEIDTVGLWPNDGYGWCECEQCLAEEPQEPSWPYAEHPRRTDTYLKFVNRVAQIVAQQHPDRYLSALTYVNYVQPPRMVVPLPNVKVCFAPFQRCFKHPLSVSEACSRRNLGYARLLEEWRALVPGRLYLFEYLMLIDMLSLPYRITPILQDDFQYYAGAGVDGYVLEFKPEEWGAYGVNAHLTGRLSWDPQMDLQGFLALYYEELYGPAVAEMSQFFAAFERDFVAAGPCVHHYDLDYTRRATPQLLRPALEHLGHAMGEVAGSQRRHREAVVRAQVGVQLLRRMGQWRTALARAREAGGVKQAPLAREAERLGKDLVTWAESKRKTMALDAEALARRITREQADLSVEHGGQDA